MATTKAQYTMSAETMQQLKRLVVQLARDVEQVPSRCIRDTHYNPLCELRRHPNSQASLRNDLATIRRLINTLEKASTSTPSQPLAGEAALLHELLSECEPRIIREALEIAMGCPDAETALIQHYRESLTDYQNALKEEEADKARERRFQAEY